MDLLIYSCLGLLILVLCAFLMLMVAALISEYHLAKRVKRALLSVSCPKCGGGPLAVTANSLFPEAKRFHCCLQARHIRKNPCLRRGLVQQNLARDY